ncbi:MAG: hypothetical protein JO322_09540 [Candidatus Eremiobacteraeota bacterium]|nr:hypothetical protein [Candidatus Eremiobacteraeota bacterium]
MSFFISTLDTGIVNVALPQIGASFHVRAAGTTQAVSWRTLIFSAVTALAAAFIVSPLAIAQSGKQS